MEKWIMLGVLAGCLVLLLRELRKVFVPLAG